MHTISPRFERLTECDQPPAQRGAFTREVHVMLMVGGTLVTVLALLGGMEPRLTCVSALWSASGLFGMAQLLRMDRRPTLPDAE